MRPSGESFAGRVATVTSNTSTSRSDKRRYKYDQPSCERAQNRLFSSRECGGKAAPPGVLSLRG